MQAVMLSGRIGTRLTSDNLNPMVPVIGKSKMGSEALDCVDPGAEIDRGQLQQRLVVSPAESRGPLPGCIGPEKRLGINVIDAKDEKRMLKY